MTFNKCEINKNNKKYISRSEISKSQIYKTTHPWLE